MKNFALTKFLRDETANMTVEFVVILPLLILWYIGTLVFFDAYKSRMQADAAAYTIADIMSRFEATDTKPGLQMNDIDELLLLRTSMLPSAPAGGWLRFSSIHYDDSDGSYNVQWSCVATGGQALGLESGNIPVAELPLMLDDEVIIMVESVVPYRPLVDWVGIAERTWLTRATVSPRFEDEILMEVGECTYDANA